MTEIRLTNSLTRRKEVLAPLDPSNLRMYVCGPTVYDRAHLGNARAVVVFDVLYRLLRHVYGPEHVTYVRNITDVDDKIIDAAKAQSEAGDPRSLNEIIAEITATTTRWYEDDMAALGALPPTHEPRATLHIAHMVAMIETLIARGHAYEAEGHVLFSVASDPDYGALSGRSVEDMIAGARVEVAPYKRDPMDFVLWKPSTPNQPRWDSPWGRGRPGWHIECSAMARDLLGREFDIHGGGTDLLFPHHENEIAQSHAAGDPFARVWLHNEMLQVEGKKMSKSLGNFFTVRDLIDKYAEEFDIPNMGPAIRLRFLETHYRQPIDITDESIEAASIKLGQAYFALAETESLNDAELKRELEGSAFLAFLIDDLNTPGAIAELNAQIKAAKAVGQAVANPAGSEAYNAFEQSFERDERNQRLLKAMLQFLGFEPEALADFNWNMRASRKKEAQSINVRALIEALLAERLAARKARDFARADALRDGIVAAGVVIMDGPDGHTEWRPGPDFDPAKLEALR